MVRLTLRWVNYGSIKWEQWWTSTHGQNLTRDASESEHVGFANFELGQAGIPAITAGDEGGWVIALVPSERISMASSIVQRHGFEVVSSDTV